MYRLVITPKRLSACLRKTKLMCGCWDQTEDLWG
jgi:hypothetical protein